MIQPHIPLVLILTAFTPLAAQEFELFVVDGDRSRSFFQASPRSDDRCQSPGCTYRIEGTFEARLNFDVPDAGFLVSFAEIQESHLTRTLLQGDALLKVEPMVLDGSYRLLRDKSLFDLTVEQGIEGGNAIASWTQHELLMYEGADFFAVDGEAYSLTIYASVPEPNCLVALAFCLPVLIQRWNRSECTRRC